jgi:hypothetical protein
MHVFLVKLYKINTVGRAANMQYAIVTHNHFWVCTRCKNLFKGLMRLNGEHEFIVIYRGKYFEY